MIRRLALSRMRLKRQALMKSGIPEKFDTIIVPHWFDHRLCGDGLPATTTADKLLARHSLLESSHRGGLDSLIKSTASLALSLNHSHHANGLAALSNTTMLPSNGFHWRGGWQEWRKSSIESDGSSSGSGGSSDGVFKVGNDVLLLCMQRMSIPIGTRRIGDF